VTIPTSRTLEQCRTDNWCYLCQEVKATWNKPPNAPMCKACQKRWRVRTKEKDGD